MNEARCTMASAISAVICTRNRGDSVVATLETVLANTLPNFEVILVDQSTNQETAQAIERFRSDPRFKYVPTSTCGASMARNIGMTKSNSELIAFTDDDCIVPPNWLNIIAQNFQNNPHAGMIFCNVIPAPHDTSAGFMALPELPG